MIVGTSIRMSGGKAHMGLSASYTPELTQFFTKLYSHDMPKREDRKQDRLSKEEKEAINSERRADIVKKFIEEALANYQKQN